MFAKIENNAVVEWPITSLTARFPDTSFPSPITANAMPAGYVAVGSSVPPQAGPNQKVVPSTPVETASGWVQGWEVVDLTEDELAQRDETQANIVRADRNARLVGCDWTQGKDIPDAVSQPWAVYRQALRDVPEQDGFPWAVQWPQDPNLI